MSSLMPPPVDLKDILVSDYKCLSVSTHLVAVDEHASVVAAGEQSRPLIAEISHVYAGDALGVATEDHRAAMEPTLWNDGIPCIYKVL